ncbi:hypothetical protein FZEAL_9618 [Fusarium zealandicum]|uniref:Uncharacterized protein n=1 Tax=Fusarium zealandicum TaxID=1053134 RepID=A0A8H4U9L4_9HYPO|nr:hypothetical protein FZEAL_9618 [Fusarium zealandicum]
MSKLTSELVIVGRPEQAGDGNKEDCEASHDFDSLPNYGRFPFDRYSRDGRHTDDPLLDKSSAEHRKRLEQILDGLREAHKTRLEQYEVCKQKRHQHQETLDELVWNMRFLRPDRFSDIFEGVPNIHMDVMEHLREVRQEMWAKALSLERSMENFRRELFELGWYLKMGQREMARLDNSESFFQLRKEYMKRLSDEEDEIEPSMWMNGINCCDIPDSDSCNTIED